MSRRDDKEKPLTTREYLGAFMPPKSDDKKLSDEPLKDRPLTIREYIGAFLPPSTEGEKSKSNEPLRIREYIRTMPSLFELAERVSDGVRATGRGVQRIWRNVVRE